jgi:hypothetical protein
VAAPQPPPVFEMTMLDGMESTFVLGFQGIQTKWPMREPKSGAGRKLK